MTNQTFQSVKQSAANNEKREPFYVQPQLYGSNAATTDIIRVTPKSQKAA